VVQLTRRQFLRLVQQAYQDLPDKVTRVLQNLDVVVERWPSPDLLADLGDAHPEELLGLYAGVPLPDREGGLPQLPDLIYLFQRPIERRCRTQQEVVEEVRVTLLHEVGHYFGLDEEDLERQGYG
jgi:predicted Zn-dependent protease with MMP-like domain